MMWQQWNWDIEYRKLRRSLEKYELDKLENEPFLTPSEN